VARQLDVRREGRELRDLVDDDAGWIVTIVRDPIAQIVAHQIDRAARGLVRIGRFHESGREETQVLRLTVERHPQVLALERHAVLHHPDLLRAPGWLREAITPHAQA
jgi:hypothetical protein